MKNHYIPKLAMSFVAVMAFAEMYAQPIVPTFTEVSNPVDGTTAFPAVYEASGSWGDFNNDGLLDVLITGQQQTKLYKNNGDDTFTEASGSFVQVGQGAAVWLDYNNDGALDLIVSGATGEASVTVLYQNLGADLSYAFQEVASAGFQGVYSGGGNQTNHYLSTADYNNDGLVDVLITGQGEDRLFYLYRNVDGSSFELEDELVDGGNFVQLNGGMAAWGDYNNDGYQDILYNGYANEAPNCRAGIYTNNGDGTFSALDMEVDGTLQGEIAWRDYNNDGNLDFIITGYSYDTGQRYASLYKNSADGTFTKLENTGIGAGNELSLAWGDLNNDGLSDVIFSGYINSDARSIVYLNNGDDTFTENEVLPKARAGNTSLADFDNDGDLDVLILGYGNGPVGSLFKNDLAEGIAVQEAPSAPSALTAEVTESSVTIGWSGAADDLTPDATLQYNLYLVGNGQYLFFNLPSDTISGFLKVTDNVAGLTVSELSFEDLADGEYSFGIQAIDNSLLTSSFKVSSFKIGEEDITLGTVKTQGVKIYSKEGRVIINSVSEGSGMVQVYGLNGQRFYQKEFSTLRDIEVSGLKRGLYVVRITDRLGSYSQKIVLK